MTIGKLSTKHGSMVKQLLEEFQADMLKLGPFTSELEEAVNVLQAQLKENLLRIEFEFPRSCPHNNHWGSAFHPTPHHDGRKNCRSHACHMNTCRLREYNQRHEGFFNNVGALGTNLFGYVTFKKVWDCEGREHDDLCKGYGHTHGEITCRGCNRVPSTGGCRKKCQRCDTEQSA